jgi:hypothetical protein
MGVFLSGRIFEGARTRQWPVLRPKSRAYRVCGGGALPVSVRVPLWRRIGAIPRNLRMTS